jgi:cytochrome b involved in lipid metabolism
MPPRSSTIQHSAESKKWLPKDITPDLLVIQDKVYDISKFGEEHPGGRVIYSYAGQDATDAFRVFHAGSNKSYDTLAKYCVGELTEPIQKVSEFEQEMRKLTAKFQTMGLFKAK